jgi:uncharacterized protein
MEKGLTLWFERKPVIGMIHLPPLPGSPAWSGSWEEVLGRAEADARILVEEGIDGLLVENYGDAPFFPTSVPPITVAALTRARAALMRAIPGIPWGVNVLRNDALAALSVAAATGSAFIRVNVHCGLTASDQGLLEGRAYETLRLRSALCPGVRILADARVKHGSTLHPVPLEEEIKDLLERGRADAVLITGSRTGAPPRLEEVQEAVRAAGAAPCLVASGVGPENIGDFLGAAWGIIVGTAVKKDGIVTAPVDRARVRTLLRAAEEARR